MKLTIASIILSASMACAAAALADEGRSQLYITIGEGHNATAVVLSFPSHEACKKAAMSQLNEHIPMGSLDGRASCIGDDGRTFYAARCDWWGGVEKWSNNARALFKTPDNAWTMKCADKNGPETASLVSGVHK